tara:strand:- start:6936 stop:8282 length:1347 start_codon:yes stop_codon:yes gene_type:complete
MNKDYLIKLGTRKSGTASLKNKKNPVDRTAYMIENMDTNKAFVFLKGKNKQNESKLLQKFKNNFKTYRENWKKQPQTSIENNFSPDDLKKKKIVPLCLDIEVAAICDLACPFCYREFTTTPDKIINEKFCYDLIDQASEMGIPSIKFNWRGEPLMNPKLPNFIKYAKQKGILDTMINTNATHLNKTLSEKIIKSGLDLIQYSFDGGSKNTYEKMRPGRFKKNKFENVYENIKNFKLIREKLGSKLPFTHIQMILTKETINEVDNFFNLFGDIVDHVKVNQYDERGGNISDLNERELTNYKNLLKKHNLPKGTQYMKDIFGNLTVSKGRLPCEQPFQRLMITYEGRVGMCCMDWGAKHPVGYVNKKAFKNENDYKKVMQNTKNEKKGYELLKKIKMPESFNKPLQKVERIRDVWFGKEISKVRDKHCTNKSEELEICKKCGFKEVYDWI